jgi:hypothetical protein
VEASATPCLENGIAKQNVYCEVGYAKARGIPFFLTFQRKVAAFRQRTDDSTIK